MPRPIPPDPGLPGARGLFGPDGVAAAEGFLRRRGWGLGAARAVQAMYRPGRAALVRYRVRATTPGGEARILSLCVETRARPRGFLDPPAEFEVRYGLADPVECLDPYLVWAFPYDPSLEGLPRAAWGPDVREVLGGRDRRPAAVSAEPLRYRPRRRGVFRYVALHRGRSGMRREVSFGKVLPASKARRWLDGHRPARRAPIRVALPTATGPDSLLVPALPGRSLRDVLLRGDSLPTPARVASLLDDLPAALPRMTVDPAHGADLIEVGRGAARIVAHLVPEAAGRASRVVEKVEAGVARSAVAPRLVHGDLYEAQVLVDGDFALGLVDLDDLGPGDPAMDAGNFTAHLVALALAVPAARGRLMAYRSLVRAAFADRLGIDPADLDWREALAMLQLATGPFRVLHPEWPAEVRRRADLAIRLSGEGMR